VRAAVAGIAVAAMSALTARKSFALAWLVMGPWQRSRRAARRAGPLGRRLARPLAGRSTISRPRAPRRGACSGWSGCRRARGCRCAPAGAGAALSSYAVNVPVVPHLVDRHEFFVAAGTPASVIGWMQRHRPAGSSQDDSGGGSAGEQWTSFAFRSVHGFAAWPDLVVNAIGARGSRVAVRVDAQVAPQPRLPGTGRGAGDVRSSNSARCSARSATSCAAAPLPRPRHHSVRSRRIDNICRSEKCKFLVGLPPCSKSTLLNVKMTHYRCPEVIAVSAATPVWRGGPRAGPRPPGRPRPSALHLPRPRSSSRESPGP
jgi:hypothetical protein